MDQTFKPEANSQLSNAVYYDKLDIFRFFSAMMVVMYHTYKGWVENWGYMHFMTSDENNKVLNTFGKMVDTVLSNGGFGVDVFFIISGFLITTLLLKEKNASGKINIFKFYVRRSLRIWPLYYLIIILSPFLISWVGQTYNPNYMANIFFYNNFDTAENHYWIFPLAHFWSLCIEEHFYIFWPFLIAFTPNKYLTKVFMLLILSCIIYRAYVMLNFTEPWYPIYLSTFSRIDAIVMGAFVGYINFINPIKLSISKTNRLIIYFMFLIAICFDNISNWDNFFVVCFKKYFYCGIAIFAIVNYLFNEKPLFEFLNNKVIRYFGKVSFGIYVYGLIILQLVTQLIMKRYYIDNMYVYFLLVFSLSIIIPIISYETFEKLFLKLKKKFEVIRVKADQ